MFRRQDRKKRTTGALAPRIPFWDFATQICGLNQPDSKVQFTPAQAAIWKSYDRRVAMTPDECEAYRELTGKPPWTVGSKAPHFLAQTLCRGGGKTLLLATIAVYEAVTNPYEAAPGETVAVVALAPRLKQSRDLMRYAKAHFERSTLAPLLKRSVSEEIELVNGRLLRCQAVDKSGGAARGPTYICALFDESAFLNHDGLVIDEAQWQAILAGARGVSEFRGVLSSTPNGKSGFFWETFSEYYGKQGAPWEVFKGPVELCRPDMDRGLLQEFMRADPEAYKREFECDFSAGTGSSLFFNAGQIEAAIMQGITEIEPSGPTASYACAVDPSGGRNDVFTVCIVERLEDGTIRQCLARGWDPKETPLTVHEVAKEIRDLVAPYGVRTVYGDIFGGQWVAEAFAAVGLQYVTIGFNAQLKLQRAAALRESLATGRLKLLDIAEQTKELCQYEQKTLPSGTVSVSHPNTKDGSDDFLDALGLAHWELIGHVSELHPPEGFMTTDYQSRDFDKLYAGGEHPGYESFGKTFVTPREIADLGDGPQWIITNAFKHWRFALASIGELSHKAALRPSQLMAHFGRELILQHCWMRWALATANSEADIMALGDFPLIPAWPEIKRRISETSLSEVVQFSAVIRPEETVPFSGVYLRAHEEYYPEVWPTDLFRVSATLGKEYACVPWTKPKKEWGVFSENYPPFRWQSGHEWAPVIENIFDKANHERWLAAEKIKNLRQQQQRRGDAPEQDFDVFEQHV